MRLAKAGQIGNICQPNALITLKEYAVDYGDDEFKQMANELIEKQLQEIPSEKVRNKAREYIAKIEAGERDFRF